MARTPSTKARLEIEAEIARRMDAGRASAPCAACTEKDREIAMLRAAKPRQPATPGPPLGAGEVEAKLRAQIRELRMHMRKLADKASGEIYMLKSDGRIMLRALNAISIKTRRGKSCSTRRCRSLMRWRSARSMRQPDDQ
jgi:hypothetical protein